MAEGRIHILNILSVLYHPLLIFCNNSPTVAPFPACHTKDRILDCLPCPMGLTGTMDIHSRIIKTGRTFLVHPLTITPPSLLFHIPLPRYSHLSIAPISLTQCPPTLPFPHLLTLPHPTSLRLPARRRKPAMPPPPQALPPQPPLANFAQGPWRYRGTEKLTVQ